MSLSNQLTTSTDEQAMQSTATLQVPGTDLELSYESSLMPGRTTERTLEIPLSEPTDSLVRHDVTIEIAGQVHEASVDPEKTSYQFTWDGKNGDGSWASGTETATVTVENVYQMVFATRSATLVAGESDQTFGSRAAVGALTVPARGTESVSRTYERELTAPGATTGFGGWRANMVLDATDVGQQESDFTEGIVEPITETPSRGGPILSSEFTFGPDGRLYFLGRRAIGRELTNDIVAIDSGAVLPGAGDGVLESLTGHPEISMVCEFTELGPVRGHIALDGEGTLYGANPQGIYRYEKNCDTRTRIAGTGGATITPVPNDELGVATETEVNPTDIAIGPEGNVYYSETYTVRRITPSGRIEPVAGDPESDTQIGDLTATDGVFSQPPDSIKFNTLTNIEVDQQGTLYFTTFSEPDSQTQPLYSVRPDGRLRAVTSTGEYNRSTLKDGTEASAVTFRFVGGIAVGPTGDVFVRDDGSDAVVRVRPEGTITTFLNGDSDDPKISSYGPAKNRDATHSGGGIAVGPAGQIVLKGVESEGFGGFETLLRIQKPVVGESVPGPNGRMVHEFGTYHERTVDTFTGATLRSIERDDESRVTAFVDAHGNRTGVERDGNGRITAVEAPGNLATTLSGADAGAADQSSPQRTEFETDANGYLSTVTLPDDRQISMSYTDGGLLERVEGPDGSTETFGYDDAGRLTSHTDPTGATTNLLRTETETDGSLQVKRISPAMRERTVTRAAKDSADWLEWTCCDGTTRRVELEPGAKRTLSRPDGTTRSAVDRPDPSFGMAAPVTEQSTLTTPNGRERTVQRDRTVTLGDSDDGIEVDSHTETTTVNGRTFEKTYDDDSRTLTGTTPEGRTTVVTHNENSKISNVSGDGLAPISIERNDDGLVTKRTQSGASTRFAYDTDGNLRSIEAPTGGRLTIERDEIGRPRSVTAPSGATHALAYTEAGNLSSIERPNGDAFGFSYESPDWLSSAEFPENVSISLTRDADGLVTGIDMPSGRTVSKSYDGGGKLAEISHPDATVSYTRDDAGRVSEMTRTPADNGATQTTARKRDGDAVTAIEYGGAVAGEFAFSRDNNGWITDVTYPDGTTHSRAHDDDGKVTARGPFSLTRSGPNGAPTEATDGTLSVSLDYDDSGRVTSRSHTVAGTTVYDVTYTYDDAGRIVERTESAAGETVTAGFSYDADGRLVERTEDGTTVESYTYDDNGNRTSKTVDDTTLEATYLTGDRIDTREALTETQTETPPPSPTETPTGSPTGSPTETPTEQSSDPGTTTVEYSHDADGNVTSRGDMDFEYSATGELLSATLADDTTVSYTMDGSNRRVARTVEGETTEYLYGNPTKPWQVTVARDPDGTRTRYHYDEFGRVRAFERDGAWYYVATDQVGSPRLVVAADGTVQKRIDRDSYGVVQSDSAPDFRLHVGFAGGLIDPDTGLVRFGQREYDPQAGRFLRRDPRGFTGGQGNLYAYADNDPINNIDRSGLSWECWWHESVEEWKITMKTVYGDPLESPMPAGNKINLKRALLKIGASRRKVRALGFMYGRPALTLAFGVGAAIGAAIDPFRRSEASLWGNLSRTFFPEPAVQPPAHQRIGSRQPFPQPESPLPGPQPYMH